MRILLEVANLYNLMYQQWLTRKEQSLLILLLTLNTQYLLWETTGNFVSGDIVCESNVRLRYILLYKQIYYIDIDEIPGFFQ